MQWWRGGGAGRAIVFLCLPSRARVFLSSPVSSLAPASSAATAAGAASTGAAAATLAFLGRGMVGCCAGGRECVCVCVRAREARCFGPARSIERLPEQRRGGPPPLVDLLSPFFFFFVSLSFRCQYNNEPAPSPRLRAHAHLKTIKKRNGGGALSTAPPACALAHRFIKREGPHPQFALSPFISPRPRSLPLFPLLTAQTGPPRPFPPP